MKEIKSPTIRREAKALQMVSKFKDDLFTELAGKFEYDGGFDRETSEKMAIEAIRRMRK